MAAERPAFQQQQFRFAGHIRDPQRVSSPPGIEDRRMGIYRDVIYNNLDDFLANAFPVIRELTSDDNWHALIRDFLIRHRAHSPYFLDIPREFLHYLEEERQATLTDPPFLLELAHYEWVELALSVAEDNDLDHLLAADTDLRHGVPLVSPLAWPLDYRYPVHRISADFQPLAPGDAPTRLLVYRDDEDEVHFLELNAVSARLVGLLTEAPGAGYSGETLMIRIAEELAHPQPEQVIEHGLEMLSDWLSRGIILGTLA